MWFFRSNAGFSMIQGMMLAGIVAGSSLVATKLLVQQKKNQIVAENRDQIEELHNAIYAVLQVRKNCQQTMISNGISGVGQLGGPIPGGSLGLNSIVTFTEESGMPVTRTVYTTGTPYMKDRILIQNMTLLSVNPGGAGNPRSGTRWLEITYKRIDKADNTTVNKMGVDIKKAILISIQRHPATLDFAGCSALNNGTSDMTMADGTTMQSKDKIGNDLAKQMCEELNENAGSVKTLFSWDDALGICKPSANCFQSGQVYVGFDSTGKVHCENIKDWMDFNAVMDSAPSSCPANSTVKLEVDDAAKKVKVECYRWVTGGWSGCSPCPYSGYGGTMSRSVSCQNSVGLVNNSICLAAQPATVSGCSCP